MSVMLPDPLCAHGMPVDSVCDKCLAEITNPAQEDTPMPPIQRDSE